MPLLRAIKSAVTAGLRLPVLLGLAAAALHAGRPVTRSFESKEILSRGPVYAFAVGSDNTLFVGSDCLSRYDGIGWQRVEIPRARAVRALAEAPAFDQDGHLHGRVWVGGIDAIGYLESDRSGLCQFVSLRPQLEASGLNLNEGIAFVKAQGRTALFVTAHRVVRWDGVRFTALAFPGQNRLLAASGPGEAVWIWEPGTGLWEIDAQNWPKLVRHRDRFPAGELAWLLPHAAETSPATGDPVSGTWVETPEGIYRLTETGYDRLPAVSAAVRDAGSVGAVAIQGGIAIGTARRGVILTNRVGDSSRMIARRGGLRDDTIYGLWESPDHQLWAGLDDGFDRLSSLNEVSVVGAVEGIAAGTPRKIFAASGQVYAVTNKAIYHAQTPSTDEAHFLPLVPFNPIFNDSAATAEGLWTGGSGGLWLSRFGQCTQILSTVSPVTRLAPLPLATPGLIYVEDTRIKLLSRPAGGAWQNHDSGQSIDDLPVTLLSTGGGQVWLSTLSDGIFRYQCALDPPTGIPTLHLEAHYLEGAGLPLRARRPILTTVGSQILAFTETEILRFSAGRGFVPAAEFAGWIGTAAAAPFPRAADPAPDPVAAYWIVQRQALGRRSPYSLLHVRQEKTRHGEVLQWDPWPLNELDGTDEVTGFDVTTDPSGTFVWIGRQQGFLRVSAPAVEAIEAPQPLKMRGVTAGGTQHFDLLPAEAIVLAPQIRSVRFDFSPSRLLELAPAFYQTRLLGAETVWSGVRSQSTAEFTGLAPGSYRFEARQIDQYGRPGPTLGYDFTVEAPWYRQWPALLGLLALTVGGVGYFVRRRLRHLHDQTVKLDRLVAERTRELEMSNAAKSEFLDSISHEIRNPLNGIVGLIALLDETGTGDLRRELGRSLKECAAGLSQVFNEVLNFSRLESGQLEVQARAFRLTELLASVRAMFLDAAVQHGSSVEIALPPDFADGFMGDDSKIRTILNNFLSNALKYAPGTPVILAAAADDREDGGVALLIEVSDQGPGVPDEEQELIFKKFARGAQARQSEILGTGIGLATCRALAKELGGSVGIESPNASGRGSSFFLRLSLLRADPVAVASGADGAAVVDRRALVVDDRSYNQLVIAGILQQLGYRMEIVDAGDKALASFAEQPFETVLLDLDLPGMTGPEIARALRRQPGGAAAVIIGTTGRSSAEVAQRCREAGMDGVVIKPLTAAAIAAALHSARAGRVDV